MINLIIFILAVIGMTHIVVDSDMPLVQWLRETSKKILAKIPGGNWAKIMDCYQCCGTWCGFICGAILVSYDPLTIFMCGCAGSFLAQWGIHHVELVQAQTIGNLQDSHDDIEVVKRSIEELKQNVTDIKDAFAEMLTPPEEKL
jgi:hypothetical protein